MKPILSVILILLAQGTFAQSWVPVLESFEGQSAFGENPQNRGKLLKYSDKKPKDLNDTNVHGDTFILALAKRGHWDLIDRALKMGADPKSRDDQGQNLLHFLVKFYQEKKTSPLGRESGDGWGKQIWKTLEEDLVSPDNQGRTPLDLWWHSETGVSTQNLSDLDWTLKNDPLLQDFRTGMIPPVEILPSGLRDFSRTWKDSEGQLKNMATWALHTLQTASDRTEGNKLKVFWRLNQAQSPQTRAQLPGDYPAWFKDWVETGNPDSLRLGFVPGEPSTWDRAHLVDYISNSGLWDPYSQELKTKNWKPREKNPYWKTLATYPWPQGVKDSLQNYPEELQLWTAPLPGGGFYGLIYVRNSLIHFKKEPQGPFQVSTQAQEVLLGLNLPDWFKIDPKEPSYSGGLPLIPVFSTRGTQEYHLVGFDETARKWKVHWPLTNTPLLLPLAPQTLVFQGNQMVVHGTSQDGWEKLWWPGLKDPVDPRVSGKFLFAQGSELTWDLNPQKTYYRVQRGTQVWDQASLWDQTPTQVVFKTGNQFYLATRTGLAGPFDTCETFDFKTSKALGFTRGGKTGLWISGKEIFPVEGPVVPVRNAGAKAFTRTPVQPQLYEAPGDLGWVAVRNQNRWEIYGEEGSKVLDLLAPGGSLALGPYSVDFLSPQDLTGKPQPFGKPAQVPQVQWGTLTKMGTRFDENAPLSPKPPLLVRGIPLDAEKWKKVIQDQTGKIFLEPQIGPAPWIEEATGTPVDWSQGNPLFKWQEPQYSGLVFLVRTSSGRLLEFPSPKGILREKSTENYYDQTTGSWYDGKTGVRHQLANAMVTEDFKVYSFDENSFYVNQLDRDPKSLEVMGEE